VSSTTQLQKWAEDTLAKPIDDEVRVPPNLIRALLAKSVVDNWPSYEIAEDGQGNPVAVRFGSSAAANKALEMLAKDAGMLADKVDISGTIDIRLNGVNVEDLT